MPSFEDKKVLVTGASRGIGRAVANAFAEGGAAVAVNFRQDQKSAADTVSRLHGKGHLLVRADVSTADGARTVVEEAISGLGSLDIVINNAGIFKKHALKSVGFDEWCSAWKKTIDVNLIGAANVFIFRGEAYDGTRRRQNRRRILPRSLPRRA